MKWPPALLLLLSGTFSTSAFALRSGNSTKQGMMRTVDVYHMMMCWGQQKLNSNEECLDWMVKQCTVASTAQGYCQRLSDLVVKDCDAGKAPACARAVQLGLRHNNKAGNQAGNQASKQVSKQVRKEASKQTSGKAASALRGVKAKAETKATLTAPAPGASPGAAPSPGPLASPAASPGSSPADEPPHTGISKAINSMPPQGFNEYSPEQSITIDDLGSKAVADWQKEWPQSRQSEEATLEEICKKNGSHPWCKMKKQRAQLKSWANAPEPPQPSIGR